MDIASNYYRRSGDILSVKIVFVGDFDVALIYFGEIPCLKLSIGFLADG